MGGLRAPIRSSLVPRCDALGAVVMPSSSSRNRGRCCTQTSVASGHRGTKGHPVAEVDVRSESAPGPHGRIPVRVYTPPSSAGTDRPALVWMHGGAFMVGDLDMVEADGVAREVCARADAVVVSVDYRLAVGGVTYPVPHDDVVAAVRWVRDDAAALGVDPTRISVGGASAGGNLAAGATLRLRDDDGWLPTALLLAYTTTHAVVPPLSASLAERMTEVPRLLRFLPEDRAGITRNYRGGPASRADGYAMPANAVLDGLCPVVLLNAEYDDLRASAEAFAAQLAVAGVDVRQVLVPGTLHGFLNIPASLEPVGRALDVMAETVGTRVRDLAEVAA
jgi:acetyl esterase